MSSLAKLAERDIRVAKKLCMYDEECTNTAAFLTHQAIEKLLKAFLEREGVAAVKELNTNDIHKLLVAVMKNCGINIPNSLIDFAPIITDWGVQSRYDINFQVYVRQLKMAFGYYSLLHQLYYSYGEE